MIYCHTSGELAGSKRRESREALNNDTVAMAASVDNLTMGKERVGDEGRRICESREGGRRTGKRKTLFGTTPGR